MITLIDRWDPALTADGEASMEKNSRGDYVSYEDHKRIVEELEGEAAELKQKIENALSELQ